MDTNMIRRRGFTLAVTCTGCVRRPVQFVAAVGQAARSLIAR